MQYADVFRDRILPLRARAKVRNDWLRQRLDKALPQIMEREKLDMWLVIAREYNEDPVIMTLLPEPAMSARRRTILVFFLRPDGSLERLSLDRYGHADYYAGCWNPDEEDQYECLARIIKARDPKSIAINVSDNFAFSDGLSHNEYIRLEAALGEVCASRFQGSERVSVGWLEHRTQPELIVYPGLIELGHAIIAEAFSTQVIQPGITTTEDVVWWMRQKMIDLGLQAWFQPSVDIQACGLAPPKLPLRDPDRRKLILPGDMLHCDMGFVYLGLCTDQQQLAYVLQPGESDAPQGLQDGLKEGNRLQDIHNAAMVVGRTGNEALKIALDQARQEELNPMIYTHPIGYHGHAAGPTIGLWDWQDGVPGRGDYHLFDDTCYSIELNVRRPIPEWDGQEVLFGLEEEAVLTGGKVRWLHGRQTGFHLVG